MRTPDYIRKGEVHFFLRHATENNFEAVLRICSNPSDLEDICNTMGIAPIVSVYLMFAKIPLKIK